MRNEAEEVTNLGSYNEPEIKYQQTFQWNRRFSDKCSIFLNGTVILHNYRYWSDTNLRICHQFHIQHSQKVTDVFGYHIIGTLLLPGYLSADTYIKLLENAVN